MDQKRIIDFFNDQAPHWDADMVRNEKVIGLIMDNAGVRSGIDVLDVACGTGVLFPDYCCRQVNSVTGVDISSCMAEIAGAKKISECGTRIDVICADVERAELNRKFDVCMVYNAFPHFEDPKRLVESLSRRLKDGGRLSIAHGMSRERINLHHSGPAREVSMGLMDANTLAELFKPYFDVDVIISNDEMYQVAGRLKAR